MLCLTACPVNPTKIDGRLGIVYLALPHGDGRENVDMYKPSTLSLAHWVLRRNFSDDFTDGSVLKQFTSILCAKPSQP